MTKEQIKSKIEELAKFYKFDAEIALKQIQAESNFNPNAVSPAGAQGLAQFMPATWKEYGIGNPFNPLASLTAYFKFMNDLKRRFKGRIDIALAGYNWGQNRQALARAYEKNISYGELKSILPTETRNYLTKILG